MSNVDSIYFLGYSGHSYVAIEVAIAKGLNVLGYFDKFECKRNPFSLAYCGFEKQDDFKDIVEGSAVFPAIGSNRIREGLYQFLIEKKIKQTILIDPSSYVSNTAIIGEATLVNPKAIINSLASIGKCCIVNSGSIIEHESSVGNFSHIAPGAILAGNVTIGQHCFIGANAIIKQGVTITDNVTVGAGAVVIKDIKEKGTWVGNPAKLISKK